MANNRDDQTLLLALIALIATGGSDDSEFRRHLLFRLHDNEALRRLLGTEGQDILELALRTQSRSRPVEQMSAVLENSITRIGDIIERHAERSSVLGYTVQRVEARQNQLEVEFGHLRTDGEQAIVDLYDLTWLLSVGGDIAAARVYRQVPARIYFTDSVSNASRARVVAALDELMKVAGLELTHRFSDEEGSWWKRLLFRTKSALTRDDVQQRLKKAERAVEAHYLAKPEAEANNLQATAAASLIAALNETENACIQVGSLLMVKATNADGACAVMARTLTPDELKHLEENQSILREPDKVFEMLQRAERRSFPEDVMDRTLLDP